MAIAQTDVAFVIKVNDFKLSPKDIPKVSQPIKHFAIFQDPMKWGQELWYPSKTSSTPVPALKMTHPLFVELNSLSDAGGGYWHQKMNSIQQVI